MDLATEERLKPLERGLEALVSFAILGPLEVLDQHRRIDVSSAKERLLLAVLRGPSVFRPARRPAGRRDRRR